MGFLHTNSDLPIVLHILNYLYIYYLTVQTISSFASSFDINPGVVFVKLLGGDFTLTSFENIEDANPLSKTASVPSSPEKNPA